MKLVGLYPIWITQQGGRITRITHRGKQLHMCVCVCVCVCVCGQWIYAAGGGPKPNCATVHRNVE